MGSRSSLLFNRRRDQALRLSIYDYSRERIRSGFKLVLAASVRRDEFFGENCAGPTMEIVFSPERLELAERNKAKAKAAEAALAQAKKN